MTPRRVIVASAAHAEVVEAVAYIRSQSSAERAEVWLNGLERVLQDISESPLRFPVAPEDVHFPHGTLRRALHSHRVLFTVDGQTVHVLHVRHGSRSELSEF